MRTLYSGTENASSWAMRAWLALKEAKVDFEEHVVDIRRPQRFANLAMVGNFSPPAAVPVLVDGESIIFDSLAIMEYANELSQGSLLPQDKSLRARARSFLAWQHSGLSGICPDLSFESSFYANKRLLTETENKHIYRLFSVLEKELTADDSAFMFGKLTLVELAFAPTVIRIFAHGPCFTGFPLTKNWFSTVLSIASIQEWLTRAYQLPEVLLDGYFKN